MRTMQCTNLYSDNLNKINVLPPRKLPAIRSQHAVRRTMYNSRVLATIIVLIAIDGSRSACTPDCNNIFNRKATKINDIKLKVPNNTLQFSVRAIIKYIFNKGYQQKIGLLYYHLSQDLLGDNDHLFYGIYSFCWQPIPSKY